MGAQYLSASPKMPSLPHAHWWSFPTSRAAVPYGLIENVVTHAAYRGRGFGKQLLGAAVAAAWQADWLQGNADDRLQLTIYAAAGFEQNKTGFQVRRLAPRQEVLD